MRIHPTSLHRALLGLALSVAVPGMASAAEAQRLVITTGDPITYQVGLPEGWETEQDDETLFAASEDGNFVVMVAAVDVIAMQDEPLPMPESEARRLMTTMIMGSDSLLLQLLEQTFLHQNEFPLTDLEQEIGTLGGERAVRLSAGIRVEGEEGWFRFHVTMRDGVMYLLGFLGKGEFAAEREPLISRIHQSFVLADAPPVTASRTQAPRSTGIRRIKRPR